MIAAFLLLFAPLAGLVLGSLVTTAALRAARGEQGLSGRSHCDACKAALSYGETLPVISYLRLGGACGRCGARIDPTHLVGEFAGLAVGSGALAFGSPTAALAWTAAGFALLGGAVFAIKLRRRPA